MSLAKISALLAFLVATALVVLSMPSWGSYYFPWEPLAAAALLAAPAILAFRGSPLGLRLLIAVWALILGAFVGHFAGPSPPPSPNSYSVDHFTAYLVLSVPAIALVGLACAVLHKEQK